jgi:hypothetical protein
MVSNTARADGLVDEIPTLSSGTQQSLVAHYDGRKGVTVAANGVDVVSWTPVNGSGVEISAATCTGAGVPWSCCSGNGTGTCMVADAIGSDPASLITYNGSDALVFKDNPGFDSRNLSATLTLAPAGDDYTVFWLGHYDRSNTDGASVYNLGVNFLNHRRTPCTGGYCVFLRKATSYFGDDIMRYDDRDTAWSTVVTANGHTFYANGRDLHMAGSPSYSFSAGVGLLIGTFSGGIDFEGDIKHLIIFASALDKDDREAVETWLLAQAPLALPLPGVALGIACLLAVTGVAVLRRATA